MGKSILTQPAGKAAGSALLMSSEDAAIENEPITRIIVGGEILSIDGLGNAFLHATAYNATFNVVVNGGPFNGLSLVEKGYTIPSLKFSFGVSNPELYPYYQYLNLTMNGGSITLDAANPTLQIDYYTPGTGITETEEGSGFDVSIEAAEGALSQDKHANILWGQFGYYGFNANATLTETEIKILDETSLKTNLGSAIYTFGTNPGTTYLWFCLPESWDDITEFYDVDSGFNITADFTYVGLVSVTNDQGFAENYRCWRTNFANSGSDWHIRIS